MVNGISKCDHIKWLITLTSDNINWLSLYLEFEDFFSKKKKPAILLGLSFYRKFTGKSVKLFYRFTGKKGLGKFRQIPVSFLLLSL